MIRYQCEKCSSVLKIKDRLAGTAGKCPKCKTKFQVPEPDSAGPESSAQDDGQEELSEEDAIFGRDFFKPQDASSAPRPAAPEISTPPSSSPKAPEDPDAAFWEAAWGTTDQDWMVDPELARMRAADRGGVGPAFPPNRAELWGNWIR